MSKEKYIENTYVEVDDGGTDWTVVDHYKLEPEILCL